MTEKKLKLILYKSVSVRLTEQEYIKVHNRYAASFNGSLAAYIRKVLLGDPVKFSFRDRAFDDFTEAGIHIRNRLDLLLEKEALSDEEKESLVGMVAAIKSMFIQINDYVRQNNQGREYPQGAEVP